MLKSHEVLATARLSIECAGCHELELPPAWVVRTFTQRVKYDDGRRIPY